MPMPSKIYNIFGWQIRNVICTLSMAVKLLGNSKSYSPRGQLIYKVKWNYWMFETNQLCEVRNMVKL